MRSLGQETRLRPVEDSEEGSGVDLSGEEDNSGRRREGGGTGYDRDGGDERGSGRNHWGGDRSSGSRPRSSTALGTSHEWPLNQAAINPASLVSCHMKGNLERGLSVLVLVRSNFLRLLR